MPALFCFEGVVVRLGGTDVLRGVDAELPDGGLTALVGPSGSGKSTMLRCCNRLVAATEGIVRYRGDDVAGLDVLALRRRVGMVFQRPTLFDGTVHDNLLVAVPTLTDDDARAALERVNLDTELLDRDARTLSGGEAQRVCLARTLVTAPDVLLMDEPTSALDDANEATIERLARGLVDAGLPIVWVSHDTAQVARLADTVVRVEAGLVVGGGAPGPSGGRDAR